MSMVNRRRGPLVREISDWLFSAANSCTRREEDVKKAKKNKKKKQLDSRNLSQKALLIYLMIIPVRKCNNKFINVNSVVCSSLCQGH